MTGNNGRSRFGWWRRTAVVVAALALVASACGDDDDDTGASATTGAGSATTAAGATTPTSAGGAGTDTSGAADTATTADAGQPVQGGEITLLQWTEPGTLDPAKATGNSGTDALRMFAVYGALVAYDPTTAETEALLAESLTPSADFSEWTLKLRAGLTFSDGSPFDAAAVDANWKRIQDPATASPGRGASASIKATQVVDATTLKITLTAPNAAFSNTVSSTGLNYIASAKAIAAGQDLVNSPVGAGPFLLDTYTRDDRLVLKRNPDWYDAPRPYVDQLTIRVVTDTQQRVDTYTTGDADGYYNTITSDAERAIEERPGAFFGAQVSGATGTLFNVTVKPFDDVRVRQAIAMGYDRNALAEITAPGTEGATNFTASSSPWFTPSAELPAYDPAAAQALVDEVTEELGGPIEINLLGTVNAQNTRIREFIQTSLSQINGLDVKTEGLQSADFVPRILKGDFAITTWGLPWTDPEFLFYSRFHSGLTSNLGKYSNPVVDQGLDAGRATTDPAARLKAYQPVFETLAKDLPYIPNSNPEYGYVLSADVHGGQIYEDGVIRPDLLWKSA